MRPLGDDRDTALAASLVAALRETAMPLDRFWFDWRGGRRRGVSEADATYALPGFAPFVAQVAAYAPAAGTGHAYWTGPAPCSLLIGEIEALWSRIAEADDWGPLNHKLAAIARMGEAMA